MSATSHDAAMAPTNRTMAQARGDAAERLVAGRLTASGWTVLARQLHVGRAELDLVAVDPGPPPSLVVIEVRARRDRAYGLPEETVDARKRARLHGAAFRLIDEGRLPGGATIPRLPLRFDLVAVEGVVGQPSLSIRHHRGAF